MSEKINILIVDDRPENLLVLESLLERSDLNIIKATSGNEALGLLIEYDFALTLLDVQMPGMDGFEVAAMMNKSSKTKHIPIIFITAISKDKHYLSKGYESGAVDFISKPLDPYILKSKVKVFLELYKQKKMLENTTLNLKLTMNELKKSKKIIENQNRILKDISIKDGLTGLYNYRHMIDVLESEFSRAKRYHSNLS
jgi:PleD family two-component response regulator